MSPELEIVIAVGIIFLAIVWLGVVFVGPPYVPTLQQELKRLFDDLKLTKNDHVVDLGAGDGRVLKLAVAVGSQASGVEINPFLVLLANWRLRRTGARVKLGDIWHFRIPTDTSYVFVFFARPFMAKLDRYLMSQLAPGRSVRVISYGFEFTDRHPEKVVGAFNVYLFRQN